MQVDAHDVTDVDEVAPLLAVCDAICPAEEARLSHIENLMIELIEDRRHLALVMLLGTIDVEVAQADDGAARLGDDLPHIAVECEL